MKNKIRVVKSQAYTMREKFRKRKDSGFPLNTTIESEYISVIDDFEKIVNDLDKIIDEYSKELSRLETESSIIVYEPMCVNQWGGITHGSRNFNNGADCSEFRFTIEEAFIHLRDFALENYNKIKKASPNKKVKLKKKTFLYKFRNFSVPVSFKSKKNNCLFTIESDGKILQKFFIERREFKYPDNCELTVSEWKELFKKRNYLV